MNDKKQEEFEDNLIDNSMHKFGLADYGLRSNGLAAPNRNIYHLLYVWILGSADPQPINERGIWYDWGIWLEDAVWYF